MNLKIVLHGLYFLLLCCTAAYGDSISYTYTANNFQATGPSGTTVTMDGNILKIVSGGVAIFSFETKGGMELPLTADTQVGWARGIATGQAFEVSLGWMEKICVAGTSNCVFNPVVSKISVSPTGIASMTLFPTVNSLQLGGNVFRLITIQNGPRNFTNGTFDISRAIEPVPEPTTVAGLSTGIAWLVWRRRRKIQTE